MGGYGYGGAGAGVGYWNTYGSLSLTTTSPSQSPVEPLSLAEIKEYLNLPVRSPVDNAEDDLLNGYSSAAREIAEVEQGRDLVRKQWDLSLDIFWAWRIELRDPLVSVDLFTMRDSGGNVTQLVEGIDFLKDTARHPGIVTPMFNSFWPILNGWPTSAILVRFTSGFSSTDAFWSDAGKRLKIGMLMLISGWYNNRLPFAIARSIQEYPYGVTQLLQYGGMKRVR